MKIVAVQEYQGQFRNIDGSFMLLVDEGDSYALYDMQIGQPGRFSSYWQKSDLTNPKAFPEAVGKFIPELVALKEPIFIGHTPTYDKTVELLTAYFSQYGEEFK